MTHIISDKTITINNMQHIVTAVDGMDRVEINNKLHEIGDQILKLKMQQDALVQMRNMIDCECERREIGNLFDEMFGG